MQFPSGSPGKFQLAVSSRLGHDKGLQHPWTDAKQRETESDLELSGIQ